MFSTDGPGVMGAFSPNQPPPKRREVVCRRQAIYGNDHYELLVGGSRECERNNHGRGNRIAGLPRNSTKILTELDEDPQGK